MFVNAFCRLIPYYTKIFALFLAYLTDFSYLCTIKQLLMDKILA